MKVLIVDNLEAFGNFVWSTLQDAAQFQVVGQTADGCRLGPITLPNVPINCPRAQKESEFESAPGRKLAHGPGIRNL